MKLSTFHTTSDKVFEQPFPDLDSEDTLILLFADSALLDDDSILDPLKDYFPTSKFIGCSTAGEIFQNTVQDQSVSVAVTKFDHTKLQSFSTEVGLPENSRTAGRHLAENLLEDNLQAVFLLSDGLNINGSELVKGFNDILPKNVVVTGGLAGDGPRFERTWVLNDGHPTQNCVTAIGFYGNMLHYNSGYKGGWDVFGPERTVTKSKGNILYSLDDKPALDLYKTYLGDLATELPSSGLLFPLSIRKDADDRNPLVRTILAVDDDAKSLTFAGDIPEGYLAQLMKANFDNLIEGAQTAAIHTNFESTSSDTLAIGISCVGRRLVLKERVEEELEATLDVLPDNTKLVGYYSYGEISPNFVNQDCDLHNQTMTLTIISES